MALATGWTPGMTDEDAQRLSEGSEIMGYRPGVSQFLNGASEAEVVELLGIANENLLTR